jgi:hypothetical protein
MMIKHWENGMCPLGVERVCVCGIWKRAEEGDELARIRPEVIVGIDMILRLGDFKRRCNTT